MNELFTTKQVQPNNKGLISLKQIQKNQQIIQCEPIAWSTLQSTKSKNCNWCLLQKQLVKCSSCKSFYYCSTQCQKKDWKYHKLQCKIYKKLVGQKNLSVHEQIATEFVLNVRLYFVLQENKQLSQKIFQMCYLDDYQPVQKRQHFQELCLIMMENLGLEKNQQTMSRLMKQFNIVAVNAFTIQDAFYTNDGVAIGIYWPANYMNHDCGANCIQIFDGRYLKIVANRAIQKNEELTISYTNVLQLYKNRSKFLKQNYFFECFCQICQVEKMLNTQIIYIKCPKCNQARIRKINSVEKQLQDIEREQEQQGEINRQQSSKIQNKQIRYQCVNCKAFISFQMLSQIANRIQQLPSKVQKMQKYKQKKQAVLSMKKQVDLKHPAFCKALETVYICAIDQALLSQQQQSQKKYFSQAYILLTQIIKNLSSWYKITQQQILSIRFFNKLNQMGKLAYNMGKMQKCQIYLQKAIKSIQKISFRNKYQQIQQLKRRYDQVKIELSIAKSKSMK